MTEVMLVVASSLAVSLVALQCVICKITRVGKVTAFLAGRATTLDSVLGVDGAALGANANFFTHSRNHGLSQGY